MDLITVERKSGFEFGIHVRGHEVICDLSEKDGGTDRGFAPAELLAGSLGACVGMMVQSYCQRHGYDGDVEVSLTLELADRPKRVAAIVVDVEVPDSVPEDKKDAIRAIARRCPVHETLAASPRVDIEIA
jgi:uncharacterized OsmC-like protein